MNTRERHEQTLAMIDDYQSGMSLRQVARKHGLTNPTVRDRLIDYNIPRRPNRGRSTGKHLKETA